MLPGMGFFLSAFWDLSTERIGSGASAGPIPWSKARSYAMSAGLEEAMLQPFWSIMHAMDAAYLGWKGAQHKRLVRDSRAEPAAGKKSRARRGLGGKG